MRTTILCTAVLSLPMLLVAQQGGQGSRAEALCEQLTGELNKLTRDYRAARKAVTESDAYKQALEARDRAKLTELMAGVQAVDGAALGRKALGYAAELKGDDQVLLLARRVIALGPGSEVLTPDQLMETFGIVIRDPHAEHAGRFTVAEVAHGGPQTIETRCQDDGDGEDDAPAD